MKTISIILLLAFASLTIAVEQEPLGSGDKSVPTTATIDITSKPVSEIPLWAWFIVGSALAFLFLAFLFYFIKRKFLDKGMFLRKDRFASAEFWLVFFLLVTLTALVVIVLTIPLFSPPDDISGKISPELYKDMYTKMNETSAESRKNFLTIIITAFGAWIGAGAAYFFGKENLKLATESIKEVSLGSRIRDLKIKDLNPSSTADLVVELTTPLNEAVEKLTKEPKRWFLAVINENKQFKTIIHEEIVWRFLNSNSIQLSDENKLEKLETSFTVKDLICYGEDHESTRAFSSIFTVATMDDRVSDVFSKTTQEIYVVIVLDDNNYPIGSLTEGQLSRALMRMN